jgi:hypothetical protein
VNSAIHAVEIFDPYAKHEAADLGIESADGLIARVLCRAHQAAMAAGAPDEARAILDVAQSFAHELAAADSGFDRLAFLEAVTEDPS